MLTESLVIKLTIAQRNIINLKLLQRDQAQNSYNDVLATIIAGVVDPSGLGKCSVNFSGEEITITPPEKSELKLEA